MNWPREKRASGWLACLLLLGALFGAGQAQAAPPFDPMVDVTPTSSRAVTPTGLDLTLHIPQNNNPNELASATLKGTVVKMPLGMTLSPSAANGLEACTDKQIGLLTTDPVTTTLDPIKCPPGSKLGTVSIETELLDNPNGQGAPNLTGSIYLGEQKSSDPLSGEMFRIFLVVENTRYGLIMKLPGQARADPLTGQVTTSFERTPQLPFTNLYLRLNGGPAASLATPAACGSFTWDVVFTAWTGKVVPRTTQMPIDQGCERLGGFAPSFESGVLNLGANQHTSFTMRIVREDGERELKSIQDIKLPEGLLGDVGSVPLCGERQAAEGTCPASSRIGHVKVAAGPGPSPFWVPAAGSEPTAVYLTGPYKDAPYGLSISVPAQAGPFDLGTVVVRSALHVDERTAAITSGVDETRLIGAGGTEVLSDVLPRILKGIVLNQREIRVIVDRKDFLINPTDCSEQRISASLHSFEGDRADVGSRFRIGNCASLGFAPKFTAKILDKGRKSTRRSWHPRTQFTVVPRNGDANIGGARVALPSSTILDQANIGTTCTRAQMAARNCPAKSVVGHAKAWSPLLRDTVEGPVYLAANGGVRPLPDLAAVLEGEIRVVLQGEVSTLRSGNKARLQNTFRVVPDAPVERFELTMQGGKNTGLLVNSADLCRTRERGLAVFTGQNGSTHRLRPRIAMTFKGCGKVRRQAARRAAKRKAARKKAARKKAALRKAARRKAARAATAAQAPQDLTPPASRAGT